MNQPQIPELGRFAEPALLILVSLSDGPKHGYAIMGDVEAGTGRPMGPGTLYAALARLEERGLVEALPPVDRRRPYRLSGLGATVLADQLRDLAAFAALGLRRLEGVVGLTPDALRRLAPGPRLSGPLAGSLRGRVPRACSRNGHSARSTSPTSCSARSTPTCISAASGPPLTHSKGFAMTLRLGGYAAILGGFLFFIGLAAASALGDAGGVFLLAFAAGAAALLVALAGLSAFQARRYPKLVWAAFVLPAIGAVITVIGALGMVFIGDGLFIGEWSAWAVWFLGLAALIIGSGLFAVATWLTHTLSRPAAIVLVVASLGLVPLGLGLNVLPFIPEAFAPIAIGVWASLFSLGWVALGVSAIRLDNPGRIAPQGVS